MEAARVNGKFISTRCPRCRWMLLLERRRVKPVLHRCQRLGCQTLWRCTVRTLPSEGRPHVYTVDFELAEDASAEEAVT